MQRQFYADTASSLLKGIHSEGSSIAILPRVLHEACVALKVLRNDLAPDGDLRWSIEHLNQLSAALQVESDATVAASRALVEVFLVTEIKALRKAGLPQDVVELIRTQANDAIRVIGNPPIDASALADVVNSLCQTVCDYEQQANGIYHAQKVGKSAAYALAGAAVIGVNASTDAVTTLGLAPWMTTLSGAVGSGLIKMAWPKAT